MPWLDFQSPSFYSRTAILASVFDRVTAIVDGVNPTKERQRVIEQLQVRPTNTVLEVGVGYGANIDFLDTNLSSDGGFVGLDLSRGMLTQCKRRVSSMQCASDLIEGNAVNLPVESNSFDAVLHFGGINAFTDKERAIAEMVRVTKPGGRIVISDKSYPPNRSRSFRQALLLHFKPRLAQPPPLDLIPVSSDGINLTWIWGGAMYLISFNIPE